MAELSELRITANLIIHTPVLHICNTRADQIFDRMNNFRNDIRGMRKIIGRKDIESDHVVDIVIGPAVAQLAPVLTGFFRFLQNIVVYVSHILSITDFHAFQLQVTDELVIGGIGKSMPNVSCVIRGNAANIQCYFAIPQGEFFSCLSFGVVKFHCSPPIQVVNIPTRHALHRPLHPLDDLSEGHTGECPRENIAE